MDPRARRPAVVALTNAAGRGALVDGVTILLDLLTRTFDDRAASLRGKLIGIYSLLIAANVAVWIWAFVIFQHQPLFLGTALLAYGFGLRHAVDADHIAAIDNVTRKLMQEGKRPITVGFFFALGHSTVVMLAAAGVAATATLLGGHFEQFKTVGGGHQHLGLGAVPVHHRDGELADLAGGVADLAARPGRRAVCGGGFRPPAQ